VNRSYQVLWATVVGCLLAFLGGCTAPATGSNASESNAGGLPPGAHTPTGGGPVPAVRVLHLNLCNSGLAACYTGQSTAEAAAVIRSEIPDVVTLNEICRDDVSTLRQALADVLPDVDVVSAFQAAHDRRTGEDFRCRNGQSYGIGVVSRWPSVSGSSADGGTYPTQDTEDPEERAWLCLTVAANAALTACTTHLADTKRDVAAAQCRYLFDTVIAGMRERDAVVPVVLGADLNMGSADDPDLRSCLPPGWALADDGGVQRVVATPDFVVGGSRPIDLRGTTDHPGLLVTLTRL
jgi:hypothetical protein